MFVYDLMFSCLHILYMSVQFNKMSCVHAFVLALVYFCGQKTDQYVVHQGVVSNVYKLVGCFGGCLCKPRGNDHLPRQHKLGQLLTITQ